MAMGSDVAGFTLLELMVAVAIVAVLAAIGLPFYQEYQLRAKLAEEAAIVGGITTALSAYHQETGAFVVANRAPRMAPDRQSVDWYAPVDTTASTCTQTAVVACDTSKDGAAIEDDGKSSKDGGDPADDDKPPEEGSCVVCTEYTTTTVGQTPSRRDWDTMGFKPDGALYGVYMTNTTGNSVCEDSANTAIVQAWRDLDGDGEQVGLYCCLNGRTQGFSIGGFASVKYPLGSCYAYSTSSPDVMTEW